MVAVVVLVRQVAATPELLYMRAAASAAAVVVDAMVRPRVVVRQQRACGRVRVASLPERHRLRVLLMFLVVVVVVVVMMAALPQRKHPLKPGSHPRRELRRGAHPVEALV